MRLEYYQIYTSPIQRQIMTFVGNRARRAITPVRQKVILSSVKKLGISETTVLANIRCLIERGYLRRAVRTDNGVSYVQIRFL